MIRSFVRTVLLGSLLISPGGAAGGAPKSVRTLVLDVDPAGRSRTAVAGGDGDASATLGQALDRVDALRAVNPTRPILIQLPPGTLRFEEAVRLNALHGGTTTAPLIIRGAPGGWTVLSGSVPLQPIAGPLPEPIAARLPEAARPHVRLYRLPPAALASARALRIDLLNGPPSDVPLEVYDAHGALVPARWPREGWAEVRSGSQPPAAPGFTVDAIGAPRWDGEPDLWAEGYFRYKWLFESVPLSGVEARPGRFVFATAPNDGIVLPGARVRIVHALSALDAPGEWWRDRKDGLLVAWPRDEDGRLEVAVSDGLLDLEQASHVHIDGVTFEHTRGDAIVVRSGEDVVLSRSTIRWVAGRGVDMQAVTRSRIEDCAFLQVGTTGLSLVGGDRATLTGSSDAVSGSLFAGYGRLEPTQHPGVWIDGVGIRVENSLFRDASGTGILIHGNDHVVTGNELTRLLGGTSDSGAIYSGRDWTARGTLIARNFLHDIRPDTGLETKGIYLDDAASGFTIRDNLFLRVSQPLFIGGGRDNVVSHNVFVDASPAIHVDSRGQTWAARDLTDPTSEINLLFRAQPTGSAIWRRRYPGLSNMMSDEPAIAKNNSLIDNTFLFSVPFDFSDGGERSRQTIAGNAGPEGIRSAAGRDLGALAAGSADSSAFSDLVGADGRRVGLDLATSRRQSPSGSR